MRKGKKRLPRICGTAGILLQFTVAYGSGEGEYITDVGNTGQVHHAALETQTETGVTGRAVLAQIHVEVVVGRIHAQLLNAGLQQLVVILTLRAAGDLTDTGDQAVHSGDGLAIGVSI